MTTIFIHGLESSSRGSKATWFRNNFAHILTPDFSGALNKRMEKLYTLLSGHEDITLIGSSFGGLMAAIFAIENANRVKQIILLAPALNFPDFALYQGRTDVAAHLYIGTNDTICPPALVIPAAEKTFTNLTVHLSDDDHLLRDTFQKINWHLLTCSA
jgi:pimeloyl-ACP methyl ester carboxylesterase